ncbi:(4Fe-4S)-binding protein [Vagococcus humatus]|uniref:Divergent 4Fe-4S mono-cluster domain-containing protein n=1 Tax=Vagococcus humatus TaxID=1889241 RepID=A0A429Z4K7_9ENTE|nr:(4Fe-4S)-binding protein [Vagococcus humatus]RST88614.1 hypothetical protein C7P63_09505 [Vagococcus humatus]
MKEQELLDQGYRKYRGKEVDVYFNLNKCQHSAKCTTGNPQVFNLERKPWVLPDADNKEKVIQTIHTCPSGALKYIEKSKE